MKTTIAYRVLPFELTTPHRFNFTYAIPGGAWLEWNGFLAIADGKATTREHREWYPFKMIIERFGKVWLDRQLQAQGWMTGCWITCV